MNTKRNFSSFLILLGCFQISGSASLGKGVTTTGPSETSDSPAQKNDTNDTESAQRVQPVRLTVVEPLDFLNIFEIEIIKDTLRRLPPFLGGTEKVEVEQKEDSQNSTLESTEGSNVTSEVNLNPENSTKNESAESSEETLTDKLTPSETPNQSDSTPKVKRSTLTASNGPIDEPLKMAPETMDETYVKELLRELKLLEKKKATRTPDSDATLEPASKQNGQTKSGSSSNTDTYDHFLERGRNLNRDSYDPKLKSVVSTHDEELDKIEEKLSGSDLDEKVVREVLGSLVGYDRTDEILPTRSKEESPQIPSSARSESLPEENSGIGETMTPLPNNYPENLQENQFRMRRTAYGDYTSSGGSSGGGSPISPGGTGGGFLVSPGGMGGGLPVSPGNLPELLIPTLNPGVRMVSNKVRAGTLSPLHSSSDATTRSNFKFAVRKRPEVRNFDDMVSGYGSTGTRSGNYDTSARSVPSNTPARSVLQDTSIPATNFDTRARAGSYDISIIAKNLDTPVRSTRYETPIPATNFDTPIRSTSYGASFPETDFETPFRSGSYDTSFPGLNSETPPVQSSSYDNSFPGTNFDTPVKSASYDTSFPGTSFDTPVQSPSYENSFPGTNFDTPAQSPSYDTSFPETNFDTPMRSARYDTSFPETNLDTPMRSASYDTSFPETNLDTPMRSASYDDSFSTPNFDAPVRSSSYENSFLESISDTPTHSANYDTSFPMSNLDTPVRSENYDTSVQSPTPVRSSYDAPVRSDSYLTDLSDLPVSRDYPLGRDGARTQSTTYKAPSGRDMRYQTVRVTYEYDTPVQLSPSLTTSQRSSSGSSRQLSSAYENGPPSDTRASYNEFQDVPSDVAGDSAIPASSDVPALNPIRIMYGPPRKNTKRYKRSPSPAKKDIKRRRVGNMVSTVSRITNSSGHF